MKNRFLFMLAATALLVVSCKKAYTCDCTTTSTVSVTGYGSASKQSTTNSSSYSKKMNKTQAQSACDHEAMSVQSSQNDLYKNELDAAGASDSIHIVGVTTCVLK